MVPKVLPEMETLKAKLERGAGEGQLEISINDGEVPYHVQVLGGGRCLVHFTPELPKPRIIDIRFNGEAVPDCPPGADASGGAGDVSHPGGHDG